MEFIRFNANNSDFINKENVTSFFKSSNMCWNYLVEECKEGFRLYRFFTNGHTNSDGMRTKYLLDYSKMPADHEDCEILWHNS